MSEDKKPAGLGFADGLDDLNLSDFQPTHKNQHIDKNKVEQIAEQEGFTSRQPQAVKKDKEKPEKERVDQINVRAKVSVLKRFRDIGENQEPPWPLGYTLERAIAALEKELRE